MKDKTKNKNPVKAVSEKNKTRYEVEEIFAGKKDIKEIITEIIQNKL